MGGSSVTVGTAVQVVTGLQAARDRLRAHRVPPAATVLPVARAARAAPAAKVAPWLVLVAAAGPPGGVVPAEPGATAFPALTVSPEAT